MPVRSQITHQACEEGWSFIAEWTGVPPLALHVLNLVGVSPQGKIRRLLLLRRCMGLPGPRRRLSPPDVSCLWPQRPGSAHAKRCSHSFADPPPAWLQEHKVSFSHITVTDNLKNIGIGKGSSQLDYSTRSKRGYSWYATEPSDPGMGTSPATPVSI